MMDMYEHVDFRACAFYSRDKQRCRSAICGVYPDESSIIGYMFLEFGGGGDYVLTCRAYGFVIAINDLTHCHFTSYALGEFTHGRTGSPPIVTSVLSICFDKLSSLHTHTQAADIMRGPTARRRATKAHTVRFKASSSCSALSCLLRLCAAVCVEPCLARCQQQSRPQTLQRRPPARPSVKLFVIAHILT